MIGFASWQRETRVLAVLPELASLNNPLLPSHVVSPCCNCGPAMRQPLDTKRLNNAK